MTTAYPTRGTNPYDTPLKTYVDALPLDQLGTASVRHPSYNADNTGATDATAAIHAARDAGFQTVYFPPGTYKTAGLTANVAGQVWVLAPGAILLGTGAAHVVSVSANGVTIQGPGKIDTGVGSTQSGVFISAGLSDIDVLGVEIANGANGVRVKSSTGAVTTRVRVNGCTIHDTTGTFGSVWFNWETTDSEISMNQIYNSGGNGIQVNNNSLRCKILGNTILNSGRMGIEVVASSTGAEVIGNVIETCTTIGISIDTADGSRVVGNRVVSSGSYGLECAASNLCEFADNVVITPGSLGISLSTPSGTCNDNTVIGNIFDHPTTGGISGSGCKRLRIIGNEIIEPGNGAGAQAAIGGVAATGVDSWVVQGNMVSFVTNPVASSGINIGGPNHLISGNHIVFDAGIVTGGGTAISLTSTCTDNYVVGNYVVGNGKCSNGITINSACTTCMIAGNKTVGTTSNAIQNSSASTTNVVAGNMCQTTSGAAITMGGAMGGNRLTAQGFVDHTGPTRFSGNLGFYGTAPIAQPTAPTAPPASNAVPAGGTGTAAGGWDTAAHRDAAITAMNTLIATVTDIKTKLEALGLMA